MKFSKYHALGNDYIIIDPKNLTGKLSKQDIKTICNRHYGVGSDGILYGPDKSDECDFALRIFNPDGSEAEKSGNGLRIFSRYLWDLSLVTQDEFSIQTKGGVVHARVAENGRSVSVKMGKVRFAHNTSGELKATAEIINVLGQNYTYYLANVGNPHCVIIVEDLNDFPAKKFGSIIENDIRFPNRTNVQFVRRLSKSSIQIDIWERGAGYTLASGSSSTAAASVMYSLGLCDENIDVHMPGGVINIAIDKNYFATMTGAVCKICDCDFTDEALNSL